MKKCIIEQMKEYRHRLNIIKAVKYEEGMEDAWIAEWENDDNGTSTKLFKTKEDATNFVVNPTNIMPVLLRPISDEEYENVNEYGYGDDVISDGISYYEYEGLTSDTWLTLYDNGILCAHYDTEQFLEDYELLEDKED